MPVRLEPTSDSGLWDRLARTGHGGTGFHDWAWLDLAEQIFRLRIARLVVLVAGEPVGILPVPRRTGSLQTAPLPFPFLGPVSPPEHLPQVLRALKRWQLRHGLVAARFDLLLPPAAVGGPLTAAGLRWFEDSTVLVDLEQESPETLLQRYSEMRRRSIRRAGARGATVRRSRPGEVAALLAPVLHEAYGSRGVTNPYPDDVGELVEAWLAGRSDVWAGTALVDDEPAGVFVMLGTHPVALSWAGGCLRRFRDAGPNVLLYHHQLLWALERGSVAADLVGRVDEGIERFKLAFAGRAVPYVSAESFLGGPGARRVLSRGRAVVRGRAGSRAPL